MEFKGDRPRAGRRVLRWGSAGHTQSVGTRTGALMSFKNTVLEKVMKGDVSRVPKQNKSCKFRN